MKMLILDDVKEYLESLSRALSREYQVVIATDIEEAKKKMDKNVNLALLDIRLSESDYSNHDGLILLGWIRENFPAAKVVMMSAYRDFDSAVDALNLGASRYLKKPINLEELRTLIQNLAEGKEI
jgi:DNA-binding NtrC family response regulator